MPPSPHDAILQQETPLISIGMSVYNAAPYVEQAVCSLLCQTYSHWELLVFDDGSSDDTLARLRRYDDPRIRVFSDGENQGLPARLNQAVALASGPLFARMDADDVAYPERLGHQLAYLRSHPEVDLVSARMLVIDAEGLPLGMEKPRGFTHAEITATPWGGFHMNHPTWFGYTDWFRQHPYRTDRPLTEDDELMMRTYPDSQFARMDERLLGYRIVDVPLRKVRRSRTSFARVLWEYGWQRRDPRLLLGIPMQAAKLAVDAFAIGTGLKLKLLRHRADPATLSEELRLEWTAVQNTVQACQNRCATRTLA